MPRASNRRVPDGQKRRNRRPGKGASRGGRRKSSRSNARRVEPGGKDKQSRGPREVDPQERRNRNRTLLVLGILGLVNAWVFMGSGKRLEELGLRSASIHGDGGSGFADPVQEACGGDPVRIFDGLENQLHVESRLASGRTLRLALLELGVHGDAIDEVEASVRPQVDLGLLAASGAPLRVAMDRDGGVSALEVELAEGHLVQACRSGSELKVRNIQHPLRTDVEVIGLRLPGNGDLAGAVAQADERPELGRLIARTLAHDVDFMFEARPGDELQVIVEKRYLGRAFHRYGGILGVRYRGAAGYFAYYYYKAPGQPPAYYDRKGRPMRRKLLRSPVAYHAVDADLLASMGPTVEFVDGREGALYRRSEGAPVVALGDGVIREIGHRGDEGEVIEIELEDGARVRYAHLMRSIGELSKGDRVRQGQLIGLAGRSGKVRASRLRLELHRPDGHGGHELMDPLSITSGGEMRPVRSGEAIPADHEAQFREDTAAWRKALRSAAR